MKDIKKIYNESIICDLTLPWVPEAENKKQILERYYNNKFNFVSLSVGVERMNTEQTIKYIKKVKWSSNGGLMIIKTLHIHFIIIKIYIKHVRCVPLVIDTYQVSQ